MRTLLLFAFTTLLLSCTANKEAINTNKDGYIAEGYDVTEYFNGNAIKGKTLYTTGHNGAWYKFATEDNRNKFEANPNLYEPQYGGYCAYAVGANGSKVEINPESYLVDNDKLYLFYDNALADTKQKWLNENPEELKRKANENWPKIKQPANAVAKAKRAKERELRIAARKAKKAKRKRKK